MAETRLRRDGCLRIPDFLMEALNLNPGTKVKLLLDGARIIIEKVALADDPFSEAAKGPDLGALDKIQEQQKMESEAARDKFEEMMKNPPEIKPEDNPDMWR